MRFNTPLQVANGRALLRAYGSWAAIREASRYDYGRGALVVFRRLPAALDATRTTAQPGMEPEGRNETQKTPPHRRET